MRNKMLRTRSFGSVLSRLFVVFATLTLFCQQGCGPVEGEGQPPTETAQASTPHGAPPPAAAPGAPAPTETGSKDKSGG
jgi:hypothetical protein